MQSTANLLNYKLEAQRLKIIIEPNSGLFSLQLFTNYWQILDAVVLLRIDLMNRLFFIELQSFERMRRQSASSLNRGQVEKQKFVLFDPGILSNRDFVVQTMLLSPVYSQIPIICQLFIHPLFQFINSIMMRAAVQVSNSLLMVPRAGFSRMLRDRQANPIKERVMSTPTWPVPYYQRIHRAYPVRQQKNINLTSADLAFNDTNWHNAKQNLKQSLKGRQVVSYTENNVKIKTYSIVRDDCENMGRAYVNDISQFLDLANKENVRIIGGKTLI